MDPSTGTFICGVRLWDASDLPTIARWWSLRGLPPPTNDLLPPLGAVAGPIVGPDVIPHASAFVHLTADRTGICFMDWLAVNPSLHPCAAMRAVDTAVEFLKQQAKSLDYGIMVCLMRDPRLANLAHKRHGFVPQNEGVLAMWKDL